MIPAIYPNDPLSKKPIPIRFKTSIDKRLRSIPEYTTLIRDAVDQFFQRVDGGDRVTSVESIPEFTGESKTFNLRLPAGLQEVISTALSSTGVSRSELFQIAIAKELKSRGLL